MKMRKTPTGANNIESKPKKTTQGSGRHSRPKKNQKRYRGQGR